MYQHLHSLCQCRWGTDEMLKLASPRNRITPGPCQIQFRSDGPEQFLQPSQVDVHPVGSFISASGGRADGTSCGPGQRWARCVVATGLSCWCSQEGTGLRCCVCRASRDLLREPRALFRKRASQFNCSTVSADNYPVVLLYILTVIYSD